MTQGTATRLRRLFAFVPFLTVLLPFLFLRVLGGREAVVVITGMLPAGMGPEAFLLGFGYVFAHLALLVLGPPLAVFGLVFAVRR